MSFLIDNPLFRAMLFFPRREQPGGSALPGAHDGTIALADGIALGYRCYAVNPTAPLVLYFHGNGDIAGDYDTIAPLFHAAGLSLLVVDYRGYGWSTGKPLISALLPDAEAMLAALPDLLARMAINPDCLFIMGFSLGTVPATHLAHIHPDRFRGLILQSGLADLPAPYRQLAALLEKLTGFESPFRNVYRLRAIELPLLVIHGERDPVLPIGHGKRLYDASPAAEKTFLRLPGAGHGDIMAAAPDRYTAALRHFVTRR